jgi:hypothetical protein
MKKRIIIFLAIYIVIMAAICSLIYLFTRPIDLKTKAEVLHTLSLSFAVIIGGLWVSYRFFIQRAYETALEIDLSMTCLPYAHNFIVFIDTVLKNRGQTRISARPKRYVKGVALPSYMDAEEILYHSLGLHIRRINNAIKGNAVLDWFESKYLEIVEGIPKEINLLNEYDYSKNGAIDFWIEPNEIYHCAIPLILPEGHYIAKVAFIGSRGGFEFWSRIFHLHVHQQPPDINFEVRH